MEKSNICGIISKMSLKRNLLVILLLIFVCLEILCHTFWLKTGDTKIISLIYFFAGLAIAFLPLFRPRVSDTSSVGVPSGAVSDTFSKPVKIIFVFLFLSSTFFIFKNAIQIFAANPLNQKVADMLPVLETMAQRFLNSDPIYEIIPNIWKGMQPIYLPAMWLPFVPAAFLEVDPRMTTMSFLGFGIFLLVFKDFQKSLPLKSLLIFLPISLMLWGIFKIDSRVIIMSQEFVVVFYYLLLGFAIFKKQTNLIIVALSLCLMSRYALAPWMIFFLGYTYFFIEKKKALKIGIGTGVLSFLLLLFFQGLQNLSVFLGLQNHYLMQVLANEWKYKTLINNNLGLAKFFDYPNLEQLHYLHLGTSLLIPVGLFFFFYKFKNRTNQSFFAICSLKLCLVFFYNLLILPYLYLFYTSTFLSILILGLYMNFQPEKN